MSEDRDRLPSDLQCLDVDSIPFTLISTRGFHCDVWRSAGRILKPGKTTHVDFVLKVGSQRCSFPQIRVLAREHATLRSALGELVPNAMFIATKVRDQMRALVMADACEPWFDLGNPANETEALPMLVRHPRMAAQVRDFVVAARRWLDEERKLIDLIGAENLVIDRSGHVRYLDSFHVFFYMDTLHAIDEVDDGFMMRIAQSIERLEYLELLVTTVAARSAER